jgi:5'-nucleotidase (lipoprotein e(P4) family)
MKSMISHRSSVRSRFALLIGLLLPAVVRAQTVIVPKELPNLGKLQTELKQYHDCKGNHGCYTADLEQEAGTAISSLDRLAREKRPGTKLAVVLDIDETAFSNYAEIVQADFAYDPAAWNRWVEEAAAPAIPGTLRLFREAEQLNVAVFFISGRPEDQRPATERNLRSQGYTEWAGLTLRSEAEAETPTTQYKSAERQKIVAAGYTIAVNLGDQMSDLNGTPQAEVSVKLADPFYYIP